MSPQGKSYYGPELPGSRSCCTRLTGCDSGSLREVPPAAAAAAAATPVETCPGTAASSTPPTEPSLPGRAEQVDQEDQGGVPLQQPHKSHTWRSATWDPEGNILKRAGPVGSGPLEVQGRLGHNLIGQQNLSEQNQSEMTDCY